MRQCVYIFLLVFLVAGGCGTHRGIYHTVQPGENIYRIALAYDVPQEALLTWNGISDPAALRVGEQLFIPGASTPKDVQLPRSRTGGNPREPRPSWAQRTTVREAPQREASLKPTPARSNPGIRLRMPVNGTRVSAFGFRNGLHHDGLDIAAPEGTPVVAAADGRVLYSGDKLSGYGNLLIIRHAGSYSTVYAHNRDLLVKTGDFVSAGDRIATVGQTGRASGPHLHFEVRDGKKAVDPSPFLP